MAGICQSDVASADEDLRPAGVEPGVHVIAIEFDFV